MVFERFPVEIYSLFEIILKKVEKFGDMKINAVKNGVMFSVNSTFLALKPHKTYLAVEFASNRLHDEFPIEKYVKISKTEYAHILRIESTNEIDNQLITWIKEAYIFNCSKN